MFATKLILASIRLPRCLSRPVNACRCLLNVNTLSLTPQIHKPWLRKTPAQLLHTTSYVQADDEQTDPELKALLKEISEDFKVTNETSGDTGIELDSVDNEVNNDITDARHVNKPNHTVYDPNRIGHVDVDKELLRYDYEEFDNLEEGETDSENEEFQEVHPISLTRGKAGVFDVGELVEVLRSENTRDICVIRVPSEIKFIDHMVIVTGRSVRHLRATALYVKKLYKLKRGKTDHPSCHIEGQELSEWLAMDLGNIILHLFMEETREIYDLETLWTVGKEYDTLSMEPEQETDFSWVDEFTAEFKQFEVVDKENSKSFEPANWHKT